MAHFESYEFKEIVKNNNLNFARESWNTETINRLIPFIKQYLKTKNKTINSKQTTNRLKRIFEKLIGNICINLEDFVIAMIACGFTLKTVNNRFCYNIADKDIKAIDKLINPEFYV